MAIDIQEVFQVNAPVDTVWRFLLDPHEVAACVAGAELQEVVDDHTFLANITVKIGPITTSYKGRIQFADVDQQGYAITIVGEGRESSGGIAKVAMASRLRALSDGQTEVTVDASADVTGRVMQFGRGMIQDVERQLFRQFGACVRERLETQAKAASQEAVAVAQQKPIAVLPLALRGLGASVAALWNAMFRNRPPKE